MDQDWLAVFEALRSVYTEGAFSNTAISEAVSRHKTARESFVRTFAKGVIRDSIRLDHIIDSLAAKGIKSIKPRPLIIIRMGIYAAGSLGSVPKHAAVNEAVRLAKGVAKGSDRFVNGMLRSYLRRSGEFDAEKLEPHIRYSFSKETFDLLYRQYGEEAIHIMEALNEPPALYLRANTLKASRDEVINMLRSDGFEAEAAGDASEGIKASGSGIISGRLFREGWLSVQSLSSMMAVKAFSPAAGSRVLDMCAAPGGKTAYMAELMKNEGEIIACDIYPHRAELIEAAMKRTGVSIVKTRVADASLYESGFEAAFDYVLCDVPCSGLGVIGSKPEIKLTTDTSRYKDLTELQGKILGNALRYVKPGGRVMYSTCTLNRDENEFLVKDILSKNHGSLSIIELVTLLPYNGKVGFFYGIIEKNRFID